MDLRAGGSYVRLQLRLVVVVLLTVLPIPAAAEVPLNVILMIGDGMGFGQLNLARIDSGDLLQVDSMPVVGLVRVLPSGSVVPDSAATATAMATGYATDNGTIGQRPDGTRVRTVLEAAECLCHTLQYQLINLIDPHSNLYN